MHVQPLAVTALVLFPLAVPAQLPAARPYVVERPGKKIGRLIMQGRQERAARRSRE